MGTDAQRARRYRRHKAGDHSLCVAGRCPAVTPDGTRASVTRTVTASASLTGLEDAGQRLWDEMVGSLSSPLHGPLLMEACRIADRLEKLDRQLRGEDWLRFRHDESGVEVTVYVDKVLAEAREQAVALKGLVAELRQSTGKAKPAESKGGGVLADLAARRALRSAQASH